jgi:hypothetical protein
VRAIVRDGAYCPPLGPAGVAARVVVGLVFLYLALLWRDPTWSDVALGLAAVPAVATALLAVRARRSPQPLRATGPLGHVVNTAVLVPLLFLAPTAGPALLFYGASMLIAAVRRSGGCEVTTIPNALLRRDDQWGCALFAPVDLAERSRLIRERPR